MFPDILFHAAPASTIATVAALVLGLLIGSFLNVVVHRLPIMSQRELDNYIAHESGKELPHQDTFNLMTPRSRCPHCGHPITALENIPVISWLALRGKCSACKAPISARYPAVELVTGLLSALVVWHFGTGLLGLATLAFTWLLISLTLIDYDTQTLPDDLNYPLLWIGLLINLDGAFVSLRDAVIGAVAGYLALWSVYWAYKLIRGKEGMGAGDFVLLAALGAWFGWQALPLIILLSSVVGTAVSVVRIATRRMGYGEQFPFGPYLAGAGMIALFYAATLTRTLQGLLVA